MGIQGSTWTPYSQMQGFGARPSSFQGTIIEIPHKIDKILTKCQFLGGLGVLSPLNFDGRAPNP